MKTSRQTSIGPAIEQVFRALADRTRLRILRLLAERELCVCDLVQVLGVPQPTASRHLAYLRRAGLVTARRASGWSYYRLPDNPSPLAAQLLACLRTCVETPEFARDARRLEAIGGCCRPAMADDTSR